MVEWYVAAIIGAGALVVGADLTAYRDHAAGTWIHILQNFPFGDYRQIVHGAGKPWYFQNKSVKLFSVIFVGKNRQFLQTSPYRYRIVRMFHSTTSKYSCMEHSMCIPAKENRTSERSCQSVEEPTQPKNSEGGIV